MAEMQPFLISEFKTGLFNYLEPWIRPQDAFEPLQNAYIYRGQIQKRSGYSLFGRMIYQDTIAVGNGGTVYGGTLQTIPIVAGSFNPTDGVESFTDNGVGVLTGSAGGSGTINYTTGAWSLTFNAAVAAGVIIVAPFVPNTSPGRPIMGIKTWVNENTGITNLIVTDTRRAMVYNDSTQVFVPLAALSQQIYQGTGTALALNTITINTGWPALAPYVNGLSPYSITISAVGNPGVIVDNGIGGFTVSVAGIMTNASTVNYATGAITLVFTGVVATTISFNMTATTFGDYFSGTYSNFFNSTNWLNYLYLTNNVDPITLYTQGSFPGTLSRPPFYITVANGSTYTNNIGYCLDVDVYKQRLIVQYPYVINAGDQNGPYPQGFFWSAQTFGGIANNLAQDVSGNGGFLLASTSDLIKSSEFLRDQMIVFFANTVWIFRYTGNDFSPFRWDQVNNTKSTNAPYATIPYDERVTAMGHKGLIACDGVNVQRYDVSIIDQFLAVNQSYFQQCFGQRFDTLNQSWMLYPSDAATMGMSDSAIIYNFLENSWSTYTISMSCLGLFYVITDATWSSFALGMQIGNTYPNWSSAQIPWDSFLSQAAAPTLLGGNFKGDVFEMDDGLTDDGLSIEVEITSSRWNPFTQIGQKVQFGWIDFYYTVDTTNPPGTITINFSTDNSSGFVQQRTLTLDGPPLDPSAFAWKRIYINNVGEFLQMNMVSDSPTNFKILGMVLWCKPSGRLTP